MDNKYQVCNRCDGEGVIVNPAVSVWTGSDIERDPDGFDDMRAGVFNVTCPQCRGKRVTTEDDTTAYREYCDDARMRALESGDYETLMDHAW